MSNIIVALDFPSEKEALSFLDQIEPNLCAVKVGSELFTLLGRPFVEMLIEKGFKVFLDLKFHDIPNTVAKACLVCAKMGVWMLNVHASGGLLMMQKAKSALDDFGYHKPLLIAVTVLTSLGEVESIGIKQSVEDEVSLLANLAHKAGLDGVVCSAFELRSMKQMFGDNFITVTPGTRLSGSSLDDQTRVMTPNEAIEAGSDYLVIGRPITLAKDPRGVLEDILRG